MCHGQLELNLSKQNPPSAPKPAPPLAIPTSVTRMPIYHLSKPEGRGQQRLPSPTLLYTRKLGWTLQPLGSYSKYGCLGLSPEILSWWSGELLLILLVTVMRSQAWEPLLHSKAIPADSKSSQRAFVSPCLD